jgi:hypothetical protein
MRFLYKLSFFTIQKIRNFYNYCLNKLLKIDSKVRNYAYSKDENQLKLNGKCLLNIKLEEFGLKNFEHILIIKLSSFIYKINNDINSSSILKNMIKR